MHLQIPKELIAQRPLKNRDESRLLVLKGNNGFKIIHDVFKNLAKHVEKGSLIVFNNTKVYKAKIYGRKRSGGGVEILLLFNRGNSGEALIKGRKVLGKEIIIDSCKARIGKNSGKEIKARILRKKGMKFEVEFSEDVSRIIERYGKTPLPPYIKEDADIERYNSIFATELGSIAAPTASLHFTGELVRELEKRGINFAFITLHIGIATFLNNNAYDFKPDPEFFKITEENAAKINKAMEEDKLIAVGTTVVKALESSYSEEENKIKPCSGYSNLLISENYKFRIKIRKMITNFHLPDSPPLRLTCAFAGRERVLKAYREAIKLRYRFYSFGDVMLIERKD